jgi:hypothetical protein
MHFTVETKSHYSETTFWLLAIGLALGFITFAVYSLGEFIETGLSLGVSSADFWLAMIALTMQAVVLLIGSIAFIHRYETRSLVRPLWKVLSKEFKQHKDDFVEIPILTLARLIVVRQKDGFQVDLIREGATIAALGSYKYHIALQDKSTLNRHDQDVIRLLTAAVNGDLKNHSLIALVGLAETSRPVSVTT